MSKQGVYERKTKKPYHDEKGYKHWPRIRILEGAGARQWSDANIDKSKDKLATIQIEDWLFCPHCQQPINPAQLEFAYSFDDQIALWEVVFNIKQKLSEKERQLKGLKDLYDRKLRQLKLDKR